MTSQEDTIAAIATALGEGGIAVIRVSGPQAFVLADSRFKGKLRLSDVHSHTAHFGLFYDSEGSLIDEVVITIFRQPHSYTGEDVAEISCHGGSYISKKILEQLIHSGARMALPGEFTKRAYLNGRIDLSQAEAVADLIRARSELSHRTAVQQLQGKISHEILELRKKLIDICSLLELELDFSEEGIEFGDPAKFRREISKIIEAVDTMISTYKVGRVYREGAKVVIIGRPNVGKSSILNYLVNDERSIVTDLPGTTRDTIEENLVVDGVLFKVVDTAGLRQSDDLVESLGIKRTEEELSSADIVLLVVDSSAGFTPQDQDLLEKISGDTEMNKTTLLIVQNKVDIRRLVRVPQRSAILDQYCTIDLSAKTGEGIADLRAKLHELATLRPLHSQENSIIITNERHRQSLCRSMENLKNAERGIEAKLSNELIAIELRLAIDALGEIIGVVTTEDVLNNVFMNFCIGK